MKFNKTIIEEEAGKCIDSIGESLCNTIAREECSFENLFSKIEKSIKIMERYEYAIEGIYVPRSLVCQISRAASIKYNIQLPPDEFGKMRFFGIACKVLPRLLSGDFIDDDSTIYITAMNKHRIMASALIKVNGVRPIQIPVDSVILFYLTDN